MNIIQIKNRDKDVWDGVVAKYADILYNIAFSIIHNKHTAEDICQQVFCNAFEKINEFRGNTIPEFESWLRKTVSNTRILNLIKPYTEKKATKLLSRKLSPHQP
jgi:RNA polymerase sigma-70 factor (ECF subfamily)